MIEHRAAFVYATVLAIICCAVFYPLVGGSFLGDDWHFFALFRHWDGPSGVFTTDTGASYVYRPLAMVFNYAAFVLFDLSPVGHYAINVALHGGCSALIYVIARAFQCPRASALVLSSFFLLGPLTAPTALWVSNRFDLLCTLASLLALAAVLDNNYFSRLSARRWFTVFMLAVALGSKELGVATALLCAALVTVTQRGEAARYFVALGVLVAGYFALRFNTLGQFGNAKLDAVVQQTVFAQIGVQASAIITTAAPHAATLLALLVCAIAFVVRPNEVSIAAQKTSLPHSHSKTALVSVCLLITATLILAVQGKVAWLLFSSHPENAQAENLRYFYLPIALLMLAFAAWLSLIATHVHGRVPIRVPAVATTVGCLGVFSYQLHGIAVQWTQRTLESAAQIALTAKEFKAADSMKSPCVVTSNLVDPWLDAAVKAHLHRGDTSANCVLLTTPPQYASVTRRKPCEKESFIPVSALGLPPLFRSGTCTMFHPTITSQPNGL